MGSIPTRRTLEVAPDWTGPRLLTEIEGVRVLLPLLRMGSSVWSERLSYKQRGGGSNPSPCTQGKRRRVDGN